GSHERDLAGSALAAARGERRRDTEGKCERPRERELPAAEQLREGSRPALGRRYVGRESHLRRELIGNMDSLSDDYVDSRLSSERHPRPPMRYRRFGGGYRREDVEFALASLR